MRIRLTSSPLCAMILLIAAGELKAQTKVVLTNSAVPYPIHIRATSFANLVGGSRYFIDNTAFINKIASNLGRIHVVTAPRRFGKSLNSWMIAEFFNVEVNTSGHIIPLIETAAYKLFHGGAVYNNDNRIVRLNEKLLVKHNNETMELLGTVPVIHLSLLGYRQITSCSEVVQFIAVRLEESYRSHSFLKNFYELSDDYTIGLNKLLIDPTRVGVLASWRALIELLFKFYNKKVFVVIDEYDAVLNTAHFVSFLSEEDCKCIRSFIADFFTDAFKDNEYVRGGFMTGIMIWKDVGLFTGLPGVRSDHTILEPEFMQYYGMDVAHLETILRNLSLYDTYYADALEKYNGYNFGGLTKVNPYAVAMSLAHNKLDNYWYESASAAEVLRDFLRFPFFRNPFIQLLNGKEVELPARALKVSLDNVMKLKDAMIQSRNKKLPTFHTNSVRDTIFLFFFLLGYFTESRSNASSNCLKLRVPNTEIKDNFWILYGSHLTGKSIDELRDVIDSAFQNAFYNFAYDFGNLMRNDEEDGDDVAKSFEHLWHQLPPFSTSMETLECTTFGNEAIIHDAIAFACTSIVRPDFFASKYTLTSQDVPDLFAVIGERIFICEIKYQEMDLNKAPNQGARYVKSSFEKKKYQFVNNIKLLGITVLNNQTAFCRVRMFTREEFDKTNGNISMLEEDRIGFRYPCSLCNATFSGMQKRRIHLLNNHKDAMVPCNLCSDKLILKSNKVDHDRRYHTAYKLLTHYTTTPGTAPDPEPAFPINFPNEDSFNESHIPSYA